MSGTRRGSPRGGSTTKKPTTTRRPTPDQSASGFAASRDQISHGPSLTKDSTSKTIEPNTKTRTSSPNSRSISPPIKTSPPQTPNTRSDSPSPASVTSTEKKVNISDKDACETEKVKVISSEEKPEIDRCAICLDDYIEPKQLDKCGHTFCTDCIDQYFQTVKPQYPCCFTIYGEIRGNQPEDGTMTYIVSKHRLPGFGRSSFGTIKITYHFPNGIQDERHPNPGMKYYGTTREAYLPENSDGRHVLELLQRAFKLRQIFTIGQSRTTGYDNVVTWNDIHHKTSIDGGMENFGYPDKTYLNRVQEELAAKGIK